MNNLANDLSQVFQAADHDEALDCCELEARLGVGVVYFQYINSRHKKWYADVAENRAPYRVEDAEAFASEYAQWLRAANFFLGRAQELASKGCALENAAKVREYAEQISCVNLNVRESLEAIARLERGEGLSLDEFFDVQLRNKNRSSRI
jgi:hypothetical protein